MRKITGKALATVLAMALITSSFSGTFAFAASKTEKAGSVSLVNSDNDEITLVKDTDDANNYKFDLINFIGGVEVVLGIGRAVGETMAVLMVTGNAAVIPHSILEPLRTIPATIAAELGEAPAGGAHYEALFLLGVVLFFISLLINFTVEAVSSGKRK